MSIAKIQRGDKVKVISGAFKGHIGVVTKVVKSPKGKRVCVKGVPELVKFRKSFVYNGQQYPGGRSFVPRTIHISNLILLDENDKPSKVGIKFENGKKVRFYKTTNSIIISKAKEMVTKLKEEEKESQTTQTENTNNNQE